MSAHNSHSRSQRTGPVRTCLALAFAPQDVVGIIDSTDNTFSTVATGDTDSTGNKYHFGAAIGNTVYFAPRSWGGVGVLALPASAGDDPIFAGADGKV